MLMAEAPAGAAIVATVPLGTATNYPVLAYSTVTNANTTVINGGNVGVSPGTAITGFDPVTGPGIITPPGFADAASAEADQAKLDVGNAYTNARNRSATATLGVDLGNTPGGLPLQGGVYESTAHGAFGLTGTLVLDGGGNPNTVFIFQSGSTLTTASSSRVELINGAQECNVFWQLDSSATLGTDSVFVGNILASAAVTVTSRVVVHGRAFAGTEAVTLDDNVFTDPTCALGAPTTTLAAADGDDTGRRHGHDGPGGTDDAPGGGTATTVPGAGTPTLPGTPPGGPGVPPIAGPPRTGGAPLHSSTFPWLAVLFAGLFGTAALGGTLRSPPHPRPRPGNQNDLEQPVASMNRLARTGGTVTIALIVTVSTACAGSAQPDTSALAPRAPTLGRRPRRTRARSPRGSAVRSRPRSPRRDSASAPVRSRCRCCSRSPSSTSMPRCSASASRRSNAMDAPEGPADDPVWQQAFWYRGSAIPGARSTALDRGPHRRRPRRRGRVRPSRRPPPRRPDRRARHPDRPRRALRREGARGRIRSPKRRQPAVLKRIYGVGPVVGQVAPALGRRARAPHAHHLLRAPSRTAPTTTGWSSTPNRVS